jgi:hypothetical protein
MPSGRDSFRRNRVAPGVSLHSIILAGQLCAAAGGRDSVSRDP